MAAPPPPPGLVPPPQAPAAPASAPAPTPPTLVPPPGLIPPNLSLQPAHPPQPVAGPGPSSVKRPIGAVDGAGEGDGDASDGDGPVNVPTGATPIAPVKSSCTTRDGKPYFTVSAEGGAPGVEATLQDLQDGSAGHKPPYAWWTIVRAAIAGCSKKRMTLGEVYDAVEARFEVFRNEPDETWKHAIRHNLSVKPSFKRHEEHGEKTGSWMIDHTVDPNQGRIRKRKKYSKKTAAEKAAAAEAAFAAQIAAAYVYRVPNQPPGQTVERIDVPFALSLNRRVVTLAIASLDKVLAGHMPGGTALMPEVKPWEETDVTPTGKAAKGILDILAGVRTLIPLPPPTEPGSTAPYIPTPQTLRGTVQPTTTTTTTTASSPKVSFPDLIKICIMEAKEHGLTLPALYASIESKHQYFRTSEPESWRQTVRSVLVTYACFYKVVKATHPGVEFWHVQPEVPIATRREIPLPPIPGPPPVPRQLVPVPPTLSLQPGPPRPVTNPAALLTPRPIPTASVPLAGPSKLPTPIPTPQMLAKPVVPGLHPPTTTPAVPGLAVPAGTWPPKPAPPIAAASVPRPPAPAPAPSVDVKPAVPGLAKPT